MASLQIVVLENNTSNFAATGSISGISTGLVTAADSHKAFLSSLFLACSSYAKSLGIETVEGMREAAIEIATELSKQSLTDK